jgi:hypothetical protein
MAGAGIKSSMAYGAADELHAVKDRLHIHSLHATILHLLVANDEKSPFAAPAVTSALTDVHGHAAQKIIA